MLRSPKITEPLDTLPGSSIKSINLLKEVGIKDAETRFDNYPH